MRIVPPRILPRATSSMHSTITTKPSNWLPTTPISEISAAHLRTIHRPSFAAKSCRVVERTGTETSQRLQRHQDGGGPGSFARPLRDDQGENRFPPAAAAVKRA